MRHFVTAIMMSMLLTACTGKGGTLDLRKPAHLNLEPPPGPPEYRQGWSDGCESGLQTYSGDFYKFWKVFKFEQNPELRNNRVYYQVWKDAFIYCSLYMMSSNQFKI